MKDNLIHIKPGQRLAAKPDDQKKTKALKIMLTPGEFFSFAERVKAENEKNMTSLARKLLEL